MLLSSFSRDSASTVASEQGSTMVERDPPMVVVVCPVRV